MSAPAASDLARSRGHFVGGRWIEGAGPTLISEDPATGASIWQGRAALSAEVDRAVRAARAAFEPWAARSANERALVLEAYRGVLEAERGEIARVISLETGKPLWESATEVAAMIGKIALSLDAYHARAGCTVSETATGERAATRFRPHGVMAVLGPFNMPGHLPNGHIVPALLAGDTVVFKPSELTPRTGELMAAAWERAGLPAGVLGLVQGGRDTAQALASHGDLDGLLFTGSYEAGLALSRTFADHPEKILALEMGGNNPLLVWDLAEQSLDAAALLAAQSAFVTAGQRCTCARRLIVERGAPGERFLERLVAWTERVRVGACSARPEPFMGPVISVAAAERLLAAQAKLLGQGGKIVAEMKPMDARASLLRPGILDVTDVKEREDRELFGPLLQVIRVPSFDDALAEANRTRFGLAAGLASASVERWSTFLARVRAGVVSWNRPTTGASGALPFGGVGLSGNHRPSGFFAADYCSYPVAALERDELGGALATVPTGIDAPAETRS